MNALLEIYLYSAVPVALFLIYALGLSLSETWAEWLGKVPATVVVNIPKRVESAPAPVNNLKRVA